MPEWTEWTEWTSGEFPLTSLSIGNYIATIRLATPSRETGYRNRAWEVMWRFSEGMDETTIASGYTLGSRLAFELCERMMGIERNKGENGKLWLPIRFLEHPNVQGATPLFDGYQFLEPEDLAEARAVIAARRGYE